MPNVKKVNMSRSQGAARKNAPNPRAKKARKSRSQKGRARTGGNMVSVNTRTGDRMPRTSTTNGSTTVSHTETYGINVTGSSDYELFSTWAIQPGLTSYSNGSPLGSWLPQIANNFDNYEVIGLKFNYRAACSTLQPGLVVFGFEPNPEGVPPTTYQELRNMHSADGSAHAPLSFDVGARCRKSLLTRKSAVVNLPTYDAGKVYFATVGCDEGAKLGFIDVTYQIRLFNPQSITSATALPKYSGISVLPSQVFVSSTPNSNTINAATAAGGVFSDFMCSSVSFSGATLGAIITQAAPALSLTVGDGHKFVEAATTYKQLLIAYTGRYRVSAQLPFDWEDLKMFSVVPVVLRSGSWVLPSSEVYVDPLSTTVGSVNNYPIGFRGFSGVATGDPNPGTDLSCNGTWEMTLKAGDKMIIAVGVRTYNSVSTTTANVKYPTGLGGPLLRLDYLGPSLL